MIVKKAMKMKKLLFLLVFTAFFCANSKAQRVAIATTPDPGFYIEVITGYTPSPLPTNLLKTVSDNRDPVNIKYVEIEPNKVRLKILPQIDVDTNHLCDDCTDSKFVEVTSF
jgi:hypothetical protein